MRRKPKEKRIVDPVSNLMSAIQEVGWTVLVPFPDRKRDAVYGILVGEDKWVDLVRSYLPDNFEAIVAEKLKLADPEQTIFEDLKKSVEEGVDHAKGNIELKDTEVTND